MITIWCDRSNSSAPRFAHDIDANRLLLVELAHFLSLFCTLYAEASASHASRHRLRSTGWMVACGAHNARIVSPGFARYLPRRLGRRRQQRYGSMLVCTDFAPCFVTYHSSSAMTLSISAFGDDSEHLGRCCQMTTISTRPSGSHNVLMGTMNDICGIRRRHCKKGEWYVHIPHSYRVRWAGEDNVKHPQPSGDEVKRRHHNVKQLLRYVSMFIGDDMNRNQCAKSPMVICIKLEGDNIKLRGTPRHYRYGLAPCLLQRTFNVKSNGTRKVLPYIVEDARYLHYGRSSSGHRYGFPWLRSDVIYTDVHYNTVECRATEHITELVWRPLTLWPQLRWTTWTFVDGRVHDHILEGWSSLSAALIFLYPNYGLFILYGIL